MGSVIVAGARTPIGRFGGGLSTLPAVDLGGAAIRSAVERAGIRPDEIEYVIMGQVLQAGAGQMTARQAAVLGGVPIEVPALTINKVCLSGLNAIALADQLIRAGEIEVAVAGGMESMSQAPYLVPKARFGARMGNAEMVDSMVHDGLWSTFLKAHMGESSDDINHELEIGREEQDEWSARSHSRAAAAWAEGRLAEETIAVEVPGRKGQSTVVDRDEGFRAETTAASLAALAPAFRKDGTITAGNASQISDGAAAVVVMSKAKAESLGLTWLAEIGAHGMVAGPDNSLQEQPANAIRKALAKAGRTVDDVDLFELNEAFAAVGIASTRALGVSPDKVNVNGGAIALGHPIGASGARVVLHLAHELKRRGGGFGAAALCGGGGQGDALLLTVPAGS